MRTGELKSDCTILLENMWRESKDPKVVAAYVETYDQLVKAGYNVIEIPMERECKTIVADAKRGKNMFALGILCNIYSFDRRSMVTSRSPSRSARRTPASSKRT